MIDGNEVCDRVVERMSSIFYRLKVLCAVYYCFVIRVKRWIRVERISEILQWSLC